MDSFEIFYFVYQRLQKIKSTNSGFKENFSRCSNSNFLVNYRLCCFSQHLKFNCCTRVKTSCSDPCSKIFGVQRNMKRYHHWFFSFPYSIFYEILGLKSPIRYQKNSFKSRKNPFKKHLCWVLHRIPMTANTPKVQVWSVSRESFKLVENCLIILFLLLHHVLETYGYEIC